MCHGSPAEIGSAARRTAAAAAVPVRLLAGAKPHMEVAHQHAATITVVGTGPAEIVTGPVIPRASTQYPADEQAESKHPETGSGLHRPKIVSS